MAGRILVIRGGAIGDFILTLPAIRLLRENFPDAHIEILGYEHIIALADGRYYALDFTVAELKKLQVTERFDHRTGTPVFATRFPLWQGAFQIPTFEEELQFIQGLNRTTGREAGIYPEIKAPAWHREQGQDLSRIVLPISNMDAELAEPKGPAPPGSEEAGKAELVGVRTVGEALDMLLA